MDAARGKTLGEMTPEERRAVVARASARFQAELTASAPAIGRIMDDAERPEKTLVNRTRVGLSMTNAHGTFTTTPLGMDLTIANYLPSSPARLREILTEQTGEDYPDVSTVTEFLFMLADMDYPQLSETGRYWATDRTDVRGVVPGVADLHEAISADRPRMRTLGGK